MYIPSQQCIMLVCMCSHQLLLLSVYIADESSETYFLNERYHSGAAFLVNNYSDFTSSARELFHRLRRSSTQPWVCVVSSGCEIGIVVSKKCRSGNKPIKLPSSSAAGVKWYIIIPVLHRKFLTLHFVCFHIGITKVPVACPPPPSPPLCHSRKHVM